MLYFDKVNLPEISGCVVDLVVLFGDSVQIYKVSRGHEFVDALVLEADSERIPRRLVVLGNRCFDARHETCAELGVEYPFNVFRRRLTGNVRNVVSVRHF